MSNQTADKAFEDMTPAEKRVAIARDLIKHVETGRVSPRNLMYIEADGVDGLTFSPQDDRQLSDVLPQIPRCLCCQIGGLLYATVLRANAVKVSEVCKSAGTGLDEFEFGHYLNLFFDCDQLRLMEQAFEGWTSRVPEIEEFIEIYNSPSRRMAAICRNLIANQGEFVLPVPASA